MERKQVGESECSYRFHQSSRVNPERLTIERRTEEIMEGDGGGGEEH